MVAALTPLPNPHPRGLALDSQHGFVRVPGWGGFFLLETIPSFSLAKEAKSDYFYLKVAKQFSFSTREPEERLRISSFTPGKRQITYWSSQNDLRSAQVRPIVISLIMDNGV